MYLYSVPQNVVMDSQGKTWNSLCPKQFSPLLGIDGTTTVHTRQLDFPGYNKIVKFCIKTVQVACLFC